MRAGGVIGARLLDAGCDVHFLARSDYTHISSNGIEISSSNSKESKFAQISVYESISGMPKCDVILLTAKGYDNPAILSQLTLVLKPESVIVILQNGLDIEKEIAKLYPDTRQICTVSWIKATKLMAGSFRHDFGELIYAMTYAGNNIYSAIPTKLETKVVEDFTRAGFKLQFDTRFFDKQWTKLALNIPLFLLTIKYNFPSREILNSRMYSQELYLLRNEIKNIAAACSFNIDNVFIEKIDEQLQQSEKPTFPSMKIDYDNGKNLELEIIFSPVIKVAKNKNVNAPLLNAGYELLKRLTAINKQRNNISPIAMQPKL